MNKNSLTIVPYSSKYEKAFFDLNKQWIEHYFKMEQTDIDSLSDPDGYIINKGGHILIGSLFNDNGEEIVVAVCALIKMYDHDFDYELAKMAVDPNFHGNGYGFQIASATIEKAKELNAKTVYLESNRKLTPAITLYKKLGFVEVEGYETPYERANIQMVLKLKNTI